MKYIKKFNTEADKSAWLESEEFVTPNVVLTEGLVEYNVQPPLKGVLIQHIDGTLYTEDQWSAGGFANEQANGVAVITDMASFVIAKTDLERSTWTSGKKYAIDGIMLTADKTTALTDFAGYNNTQLMLATDTSGAGYSCANYTFPNGDKGYLPALGELNEAYANKSAIDSLMTKIGGAALQPDYYWSSTQYDSIQSWLKSWKSDYSGEQMKKEKAYVRAFSAL